MTIPYSIFLRPPPQKNFLNFKKKLLIVLPQKNFSFFKITIKNNWKLLENFYPHSKKFLCIKKNQ